jgi:glycosyltransferase involved in cell wall biosynthesis
MARRPRILSISFSEYTADARVLRQLAVLADYGDVTTIGYGTRPAGSCEHLELVGEPASLPQTPLGVVRLALHRYASAVLDAPANRAALALLAGRSFDLVVANEARALPLARAVANGAPIWGDMHEWAPEERTHVLSWRLLVAPMMRYICAQYLPTIQAVTTVNGSIARLYEEQFGVPTEIVRNAIAYQPLSPSPLQEGRIRLVHSGVAVPGRNLEALIDATRALDDRFTLDFYLIGARDGGRYLEQLRRAAGESPRIVFHDAVAPHELPSVLNAYDVGIFVLPHQTTNHRFVLPNKFFDFAQARLALVFGPAVETSALIEEFGLGIITDDFGSGSIARSLARLTREDLVTYKANANAAAHALSSERDEAVQRAIIERLLAIADPRDSRAGTAS